MSIEQDQERAVKRFRTRQEHIYHSEDVFAKKKEHRELTLGGVGLDGCMC